MLEGVSPTLIAQGGAATLLLLILAALLGALWKGIIFTRPQVDKLMEIQDGRVKVAEEREARALQVAEKWQETAQTALSNNEDSLEHQRLVISLLQSVQTAQNRAHRR